MYEKISEIHIREEKVKKLKGKILKEIEKEIEDYKNDLIYYLTEDMDNKYFEYAIEAIYRIYKLRDYVNLEHSFMCEYDRYYDKDAIVYEIPIDLIDIWLKDNFNFANTFLFNIEDDDLIVESILNDEYFGVDFTGIITKNLYDGEVVK